MSKLAARLTEWPHGEEDILSAPANRSSGPASSLGRPSHSGRHHSRCVENAQSLHRTLTRSIAHELYDPSPKRTEATMPYHGSFIVL